MSVAMISDRFGLVIYAVVSMGLVYLFMNLNIYESYGSSGYE